MPGAHIGVKPGGLGGRSLRRSRSFGGGSGGFGRRGSRRLVHHAGGEIRGHDGNVGIVAFLRGAVSQGQGGILLVALEGFSAVGGHGRTGIGDLGQLVVGKGHFADGLHIGAEGQGLEVSAHERLVTNDAQGGGQLRVEQVGAAGKNALAQGLQAFCPVNDPQRIAAVEGIVLDRFEGGGEFHINQTVAVREAGALQHFHALGNIQHIHRVIRGKGSAADGAHSHAADGGRNVHAAGRAVVLGDGAGGGIKGEVAFRRSPVNDNGILAAGLNALEHLVIPGKGSLVGVHLIVGHIDHAVGVQIVEGLVGVIHWEQGTDALKGHALERSAANDRAMHQLHRGRDDQALQAAHVTDAAGADDHQLLGQGQGGDGAQTCQRVPINVAHRIRDGQAGDLLVGHEGHIVQAHDLDAVHLGGDLNVALDLGAVGALHHARGLDHLPGGFVCHRGQTGKQHHHCQQEAQELLHGIIPFIYACSISSEMACHFVILQKMRSH